MNEEERKNKASEAVKRRKKNESRNKIGYIVAAILIAAAYFDFIEYYVSLTIIPLMIAYICFANSVGDDNFDDLNTRVMVLGMLVALLSVVYFMSQSGIAL